MKIRAFMTVSCFFLFLFSTTPAFSSEICSTLGGTCRDACGANESKEVGAFEDCTEKEECCVSREAGPGKLACCVFSFDPKSFGAANCGQPSDNTCPKGSGSPVSCEKLIFCK